VFSPAVRPAAPPPWLSYLCIFVPFAALVCALAVIPYLGIASILLPLDPAANHIGFLILKRRFETFDVKNAKFMDSLIAPMMIMAVSQLGVMAAYPYISNFAGTYAGTWLSLWGSLSVQAVLAALRRLSEKELQRSGDMDHILETLTLVHWNVLGFADGSKFATLLSTVVDAPRDLKWMSSLLTTVVLGVMGRTGWLQHGLYKMTRRWPKVRPMFLPSAISIMTRHLAFTASLPKSCFPFTMFLARFVLSQAYPELVVAPAHVNLMFVILFASSLLGSMLEDTLVYAANLLGMTPQLDKEAEAFYDNLPLDYSMAKALVNLREMNWRHVWNFNMFIAGLGSQFMSLLCSFKTICGFSVEAVPEARPILYYPPGFKM